MALNKRISDKNMAHSVVQNGEMGDSVNTNGVIDENFDEDTSGTDAGPESPASTDLCQALPSPSMTSNGMNKLIASNSDSSTSESTPDKRECPCELCSGTQSHILTMVNDMSIGIDRNRNTLRFQVQNNPDVEQQEQEICRPNVLSTEEGIGLEIDFETEEPITNGGQDGMNMYFEDNLHLFHQNDVGSEASTPEASPRNKSLLTEYQAKQTSHSVVTSWGVGDYITMTCSSSRHSGIQSSNGYGSDKGSDYDSDEGGVYVLPDDLVASCNSNKHTALNDSSEDQGDFIDTDIPKNPYACSGDSSNSDSRRNSTNSSYEDLRRSNICPPNSENRTSTDEESFTKLVFHRDSQASSSNHRPEQAPSSQCRSHLPSYPASSVVASNATNNGPVLRPTNLFKGTPSERESEKASVMFASASTGSSSPFTMSSAAFMSSPFSDNSALNAPTSDSSVFISPERELPSRRINSAARRRRETFLRNRSMDNSSYTPGQCPLRPAKSSGDLEQRDREQSNEFNPPNHQAISSSQSHHQNLSHDRGNRGSTALPGPSIVCRNCNKRHVNSVAPHAALRRTGSAGVSVVEGNEQSQVVLPREDSSLALRNNSEDILTSHGRSNAPSSVCLLCHRRRFGDASSWERNDCDVLETARTKHHEFCLFGRCTCSLRYYFHCDTDSRSDPGVDFGNSPETTRSHSSQSHHAYGRVQNVSNCPLLVNSQNILSGAHTQSPPTNNLSRLMRCQVVRPKQNVHNVAFSHRHTSQHSNTSRDFSPDFQIARSIHTALVGPALDTRLENISCASSENQPETQENENNDNIENGRAMVAGLSPLNIRVHESSMCSQQRVPNRRAFSQNEPSVQLVASHYTLQVGPSLGGVSSEQLVRDRGMRSSKLRDNTKGSLRSQSRNINTMRILPLLLRSATKIDEMDPEAVMELSSMLQNDDESEDDAYVDFQKILKDYMVQKFYEKHSVAAGWYRCAFEQETGTECRVPAAMIWTEYQAYLVHQRQVGASACGATAVINVLKALKLSVDHERVCAAIKTSLRAEEAPTPDYLLSRAVSGTVAEQLIAGVEVCGGQVRGRFFHMFPRRRVCVRRWLACWIQRGAVPVLTLNLQKAVPSGYEVPDAWHHQMVFGVDQQGVYLTNPQELVPEHVLLAQLSSDGVLLVRRDDVINRWRPADPGCDLRTLISQPDPRWRTMNVLGQVVNVLREEGLQHHKGFRPQLTDFVRIPAMYRSGVTLFIRTDNPNCRELESIPELEVYKNVKVREVAACSRSTNEKSLTDD